MTENQNPECGEPNTPADAHHCQSSEELAALADQFKAFAKEHKENNEKQRSKDRTISILEGCVAVGVAIYTIITAGIFCINSRALSVQRDTEIRQLRAYVGIATIDFRQTASSINKQFFDWFVIPVIENSGNTPALRMIHTEGTGVVHGQGGISSPEFLIPGVIYPDASNDPEDQIAAMANLGKPLAETVLSPHFKINVGGGAFLLNDIQSGKSHTYIFGVASCDDVFPLTAHHITKWCFRIGSHFSENGGLRPAAFPCTHWNCVDEECADDRRAYYRELNAIFKKSGKKPPQQLEIILQEFGDLS